MKNLACVFGAAVVALGSWCAFGETLSPANYSKKIEITLSDDAQTALGENTLTDFPVLVRLSTAIENFSYGDFKGENGSDLRFALEDGTLLSSEIDTWDESGTSLVWVKVPSLTAATKIIAYYGNENPDAMTPSDTWNSDYVAVYHLGESAVPLVESSGRASNFTTAYNSSGIGYQATGAIGKSVDFKEAGKTRGFMAPDHDNLDGFAAMTLEIWTYQSVHGTYAIVDKREKYNTETSWQLYDSGGNDTSLFGVDTTTGKAPNNQTLITPPLNHWNYQVHTYDSALSANRMSGYLNGSFVKSATGPSGSVYAGTAPMYLGIFQKDDNRNFPGKVDELRLSKVARSAAWIQQSYETVNSAAYFAYGAVQSTDDSAVRFDGSATVTKDGASFKVSATTTAESGDGTISIEYGTLDAYNLSVKVSDTASPSTVYTGTLVNLVSDMSYQARFKGENSKGTITRAYGDKTLYNGTLTIAAGEDADEKSVATPGTITVTRADTYGDLVVNYTTGGTAVAGTNYQELPGTITIPNGQTSANIEVYPLRARNGDHTVEITLADGLYFVNDSAKAATITIKTLVAPEGWNTWIASEAGKASVAANWSGGVPKATDKILFDGRYSTANCEWDADAVQTVAAFKQSSDYTGTVEFDTEFPTYASATFPLFTVSGDCELDGGTWTHRGNYANYGATTESSTTKLASKRWCLNVVIGGDLTVASAASIDVTGKGFGHPNNQNAPAYGGWGYTNTTTKASCAPYGSITEPFDLGMGARSQGDQNSKRSAIGGGAVKLVVTGDVTVDGSINALGNIDLNVTRSGGTGGSIWIDANQVSGSGTINASGCPPSSYTSDCGVAVGSGGRIALYTKSTLAMARANLVCNGSAYAGTYGTSKTKIGSCGTIFIKDPSMTGGVLFLKQQSGVATSLSANTEVPLVSDLTLNGIEFDGCAALSVDPGTTLTLPGGLASVTSTATSIGVNGIVSRGGAINFGNGDQTISNWMFEPAVSFTFPANLTLSNCGAVGILRRNICGTEDAAIPTRAIDFSVAGDLTIDTTSAVDVSQICGYSNYGSGQRSGWHGGWTTYYDKSGNKSDARTKTYGSVFNPTDSGSSPTRSLLAGGAVTMTVGGELALAGKITANGYFDNSPTDNSAPPSGGSVNLTAGTITGSGEITANGGAGKYCYAGGGAGGRVAIKLTNSGASIPDTVKLNAQGRYGYQFYKNEKIASAGTVYVETAADGAKGGAITISNWADHPISDFTSATVIPTTPIVAYNGGDAVADFKKAKLVVTNNAIAEVSVDALRLQTLDIAANSKLDLSGRALKVSRALLGGKKLAAGVYTAESAAVAGYVTDSGTGGTLTVKPDGLQLILR